MSGGSGFVLTLMLIVGHSHFTAPERVSVSVSHQRFNTLDACALAGEAAKAAAPDLTPNARTDPGFWRDRPRLPNSYSARAIYFCTADPAP